MTDQQNAGEAITDAITALAEAVKEVAGRNPPAALQFAQAAEALGAAYKALGY